MPGTVKTFIYIKSPNMKVTWLGGSLALQYSQNTTSPECQVPGRW